MQLMTWPLARFGSRFGLLLEPYQRRVMHSALGRFMDQPMDLAVGLIDEEGVERVMPFTQHGEVLYGCEQFERVNSLTYRGYDERSGLRFEFNLHSPFYPQHEELCLMPVIFMELRVMPAENIRWRLRKGMKSYQPPEKIRLFIRVKRPDTRVEVGKEAIDLTYNAELSPSYDIPRSEVPDREVLPAGLDAKAFVHERIQSLNDQTQIMIDEEGGHGLQLELRVTGEGSGVKWRLVWGAYTDDPVMQIFDQPSKFKYTQYWDSLDHVMQSAIENRDDMLLLSRRFEKLIGQATIIQPKRHLLAQSMHSFFANTFWMIKPDGQDWFSNWEGTCFFHSTVDVEYNLCMFYLALWPDLMKKTMNQWTSFTEDHKGSAGLIMAHDMGCGLIVDRQQYPHLMPVEENSNFLLMLQAYMHWVGDESLVKQHSNLIERLAWYLIWTDRDDSGFPTEGVANTVDDANPAIQYSRKQTYLAIKRVAALQAAANLLQKADLVESAGNCRQAARRSITKIEVNAWLNDHFAVCVDKDTTGLRDVNTGKPLPMGELEGWDDYHIYSANGLLLPMMVGQVVGFSREKVVEDILNSARETLTPYGCSHCSSNKMNVWISQNIWRDMVGRYFRLGGPELDARYWDMQVYSNSGQNSFGYIDTYIGNELAHYPRGAVTWGYLLAGPRLMIDRMGHDGPQIVVDPDRHKAQRWPLLPLADWSAGRVPVCVVDTQGKVVIEGPIAKIEIKDQAEDDLAEAVIG